MKPRYAKRNERISATVEELDASIRRQEKSLLFLIIQSYPKEALEMLEQVEQGVEATDQFSFEIAVELYVNGYSSSKRQTDWPIYRAARSLLTLWKRKRLVS